MLESIAREEALHADLVGLIGRSRTRTASLVNSELIRLHWLVGERLRGEVLSKDRPVDGARLVELQGARLAAQQGRGFDAANLGRMVRFTEAFPDPDLVGKLSRHLSWSQWVFLSRLPTPEVREAYAKACAVARWNLRELREAVGRRAYERAGSASDRAMEVSLDLEKVGLPPEEATARVFRDPYVVDFLGLARGGGEDDLEASILRRMEAFLLESGKGMSLVERHKRMVLEGEDVYLDLLFHHRGLRCLVAVEWKIGRFATAHQEGMQRILRWLDRHERLEEERSPIGMVLCATRGRIQVEVLVLDREEGRIAGFWEEMPSRSQWERVLLGAMTEAREGLARRQEREAQAP